MDFKLIFSKKQKRDLEETKKQAKREKQGLVLSQIGALELLSRGLSIKTVADAHEVTSETIRNWVKAYLREEFKASQVPKGTGRPPKLTTKQRTDLYDYIVSGPEACGFAGACWRSQMVQKLIEDKFGVTYNVNYISELLKNMGLSYQRASFVARQRDDKARETWLTETWSEIMDLKEMKNSYVLFGDECSFAQWGTCSYTWAPKGFTPLIQNGGSRKNYKIFGAIDYTTGKLFSQATYGKLNGESYIAFLSHILQKTRKHIILIQDGAPYHKSKKVRGFISRNVERLSVYTLPSYSPDLNPIEKLWKKIKTGYTHLQYFPTFENLVEKVDCALEEVSDNVNQWVTSLFEMYKKIATAS